MKNNNISLSLFFDVQRTYATVIQTDKGVKELLYINSTEHPVSSSTLFGELNNQGIDELKALLKNINYIPDEINIALPNDNFVVTQIPYKDRMTGEELKELIELEIKHHYDNDVNIFKLNCILTPFFDNNQAPDYIFLTLFEKRLKGILEDLVGESGKVTKILTGQFAALNSFLYNYSDSLSNNIILFGIYENELEISLLTNGKPVTIYYKAFTNATDLLGIALSEYNNLKSEYTNGKYQVYSYGNRLTASFLEQLDLAIGENNIKRMNAFRKFSTMLDTRTKEYCSRTAHIHAATLGASLPDFTEHILLFPDENN